MPNWIILFAKEPIAGASKTRIGDVIGHAAARDLAEAFVLDTLAMIRAVGARLMIAYAPRTARPWFAEHARSATLFPQPDDDFGARVNAALDAAFAAGARRCVVVGMDIPHLEPKRVMDAFTALDRCDVCLGPAEDGGYYLIGLKQPAPRLFEDVPWSTSEVRRVTLERAREARLGVVELALEFDVDEASDLARLRDVLTLRTDVGARTRERLRELDHGPGDPGFPGSPDAPGGQ